MTTTTVDVVALIKRAKTDPTLQKQAAHWSAIAIGDALKDDHNRSPGKLRASDAGACVLSLWADVHDLYDVAEDVEAQLFKMDTGTMIGAHYASLLKAAIECETSKHGLTCDIEVALEADGITGHADAIISRVRTPSVESEEWYSEPIQVVEFKSTFGGFSMPNAPDEPYKNGNTRLYHVHQAVRYAISAGAPLASVVTVNPAKGMRQDDYLVGDWIGRTDLEFARLAAALGEVAPAEDRKEAFRCSSCRFSKCPKNENPLREIAAV